MISNETKIFDYPHNQLLSFPYKMKMNNERYQEYVKKEWKMFEDNGVTFPPVFLFTNIDGGMSWYYDVCKEDAQRRFEEWSHPFALWNTFGPMTTLYELMIKFWKDNILDLIDMNDIAKFLSHHQVTGILQENCTLISEYALSFDKNFLKTIDNN